MSVDMAFYLLSIMNGSSFVGRLVPPYLADRHFGRLNGLIIIDIVSGVVAFCLPQCKTHAGLVVWTAFFGFFSGAVISLSPAAFAEFTPHPGLIGTYSGQAMAVISIAALTGSPIAGAILDRSGWEGVSAWMGAVMLGGGVFAGVGRILYQRKLVVKI